MFNFKPYGWSLFSLAVLLPVLPRAVPPASACAIVDATTQVGLHSSSMPANQQNTVNTGHDDNCLGNAAVGTTTQVGIGSTPPEQINQSDYFVGGGEYNDTGLTSPYIEVTPETQIDLQIPTLE